MHEHLFGDDLLEHGQINSHCTTTKKSHFPLAITYCKFVLRKGWSHPKPSPITDRILYISYAGNHMFFEFVNTKATAYLGDCFTGLSITPHLGPNFNNQVLSLIDKKGVTELTVAYCKWSQEGVLTSKCVAKDTKKERKLIWANIAFNLCWTVQSINSPNSLWSPVNYTMFSKDNRVIR